VCVGEAEREMSGPFLKLDGGGESAAVSWRDWRALCRPTKRRT